MMFDIPPTGPAIEVSGLTKRFGSTLAVDDLSFTVPFGAITGFVGGNGSGKTTTMRAILGLTRPTAGTTRVAGRPLEDSSEPRRIIGAQVDRVGAHRGLTGRAHLELLATAAGFAPAAVDRVLDEVGLGDAADRKTKSYSTGMARRLALAAALLGDASILLLDEPSNGLDPEGIRWLRTLLRAKADDGAAVFVSTHQLAELAAIVDHLVVLDDGRLAAAGPAPELLSSAGVDSIEDLLLARSDA